MISVGNANAYFEGRTVGKFWDEYSGEQKEAAITQARRDLSRAIGRPMNDDEPPYVEGDRRRDEYAVYEQALYTLLRDTNPEGGGSAVPSLNGDEVRQKNATLAVGGGKWSIEALSWLCDKLSIVTKIA